MFAQSARDGHQAADDAAIRVHAPSSTSRAGCRVGGLWERGDLQARAASSVEIPGPG
jgi:hypothetical protein